MSDSYTHQDELTRWILGLVDDRIRRHRQSLTQTSGTVPSTQLPPASPTDRGGVTLSDSTPADVTANSPAAGSGSSVSRADHVHALASTAVTPGSYGDTGHIAAFTVDTDGRLTAASNVSLSSVYQPLDADLTAIAALAGTGLAARTATDMWALRTIAGTSNRIDVSNGAGTAGNPTIDISASYVGQSSITTLGTVGTGVWQGTAVAAAYGGTGQSSYTTGDLLYASGATALSKLADVATGNALISGGVGVAPSWGKIGLATHISGTLGLANGGTNADLSATGGTGQYLRQSSAGAAISVGTIPYSDLTYSSLTTGQVLRATSSTSAAFGALDLANSSAITGALPIANGGTGQTTANAGFAALSPMSARGDLITRDASVPVRLAIGSSAKYLRSDGTDPSWQAIAYGDLTYSSLTTGQVLRATTSTSAQFGALDLANGSAVTDVLPASHGGTGQNNGAQTLALNSGGTLALNSLTLTLATNSGTIDFLSASLTLSYDQNTWTPTYTGSATAGTTTYTTQTGTYTRVGNIIVARFLLVWTNATGTGNVRIGGFPTSAAADTTFAIFHQNVTFANGSVQALLQGTTARLFSPATNAAGTEVAIETAGTIYGMIAYLI